MKVAIIGSRGLRMPNLGIYLPKETTEIVSGGARGIDACARKYADAHGIKLMEFLPEYEKYGRNAPLKRNQQIIDYADMVIAFWDGKSHGTEYAIDQCICKHKGLDIYVRRESGKIRLALTTREC